MAGKFESPRAGRGSVPKAAPQADREKAPRQGAPAAPPVRNRSAAPKQPESNRRAPTAQRKSPAQAAAPSQSETGRTTPPSRMPPLRPEGENTAAPRRTSGTPSGRHAPANASRSASAPSRQAPNAARPRRRRRKRINVLPIVLAVLVLVIAVVLVIAGIRLFASFKNTPAPDGSNETIHIDVPERETTGSGEAEPTEPEPEPEHVVATASVGTIGDLLMHSSLLVSARDTSGAYDFSYMFRYLAPYAQARDYAIANLETTFGGSGFPYQGNPSFNCPDPLAQNAKDAGFDMFLTANNHCYDTVMTGLNRTLEVSRAAGLKTIGTRLSADEPRYEIADINGIKIGFTCYTYADGADGQNRPSLNWNAAVTSPEQLNWFHKEKPEQFYADAELLINQMREQGAEAIMFFIHWGEEYQLAENASQDEIAQKLCDLGVDVIVGGHPHVIEPMALLTSRLDDTHKTVCIFSLGNAVSNQRIAEMRLKTGHTEDGCMFTVTFEKYSDGNVYLASADVMPTWVNMYLDQGKKMYDILPLDDAKRDSWKDIFGLTDETLLSAQSSYNRTMDLVGGGLKICNNYLQEQKALRDGTPAEAPAETADTDAA